LPSISISTYGVLTEAIGREIADLLSSQPSVTIFGKCMALIVQKFGGTSVGTIERMGIVADIIAESRSKGNRMVVVVSAMGHETDRLKEMALEITKSPAPREMDMLLTAGERVSMSLLSIALQARGVVSKSFTGSQSGILTDGVHGNARIERILGDRIRNAVNEGAVAIVAGFQGMSTDTKEITTLGRGGSDLTAVALAVSLKADACEIFTDVRGVCSADPRVVRDAKVLEKLSWSEMTELAWMGAGVMHTRAAHLAEINQMPVIIRSSFERSAPGTVVEGLSMEKVHVSAIAQKSDAALISLRFGLEDKRAVADSIDWLWKRGVHPLVCQQSLQAGDAVELKMVLDNEHLQDYVAWIDEKFARSSPQHLITDGLAAITIVGHGFWQSPETISKIIDLVDAAVELIDVKNNAVTLCVDFADANETVKKLHVALVG
jgi:aspartate kinase